MLQLHTPAYNLPDNIWHTVLIAAVSCLLIWGGWRNHLLLLDEIPAGEKALSLAQEPALVLGEGQTVYVWVEQIIGDEHPLLLNRILSAIGWIACLFMIGRILSRVSGFLLSLPSLIILLGFPGMTSWMLAGGSGSLGLFFFLLGFSALLLEEVQPNWIRAGAYLGLGVFLYPLLLLPAIALMMGTFEWDKHRAIRSGIGCAVSGLVLAILAVTLSENGLKGLVATYATPASPELDLWMLFSRNLFLLTAAIIGIGFGALKRGVSWWALCASFVMGLVGGINQPGSWIPFFILLSLSLVKVPTLLGIRHPRAAQSILLCQLLLWVPVVFT